MCLMSGDAKDPSWMYNHYFITFCLYSRHFSPTTFMIYSHLIASCLSLSLPYLTSLFPPSPPSLFPSTPPALLMTSDEEASYADYYPIIPGNLMSVKEILNIGKSPCNRTWYGPLSHTHQSQHNTCNSPITGLLLM